MHACWKQLQVFVHKPIQAPYLTLHTPEDTQPLARHLKEDAKTKPEQYSSSSSWHAWEPSASSTAVALHSSHLWPPWPEAPEAEQQWDFPPGNTDGWLLPGAFWSSGSPHWWDERLRSLWEDRGSSSDFYCGKYFKSLILVGCGFVTNNVQEWKINKDTKPAVFILSSSLWFISCNTMFWLEGLHEEGVFIVTFIK